MTVHDTRRDQIIEALHLVVCRAGGQYFDPTETDLDEYRAQADAVIPILDAAVAEARAETAEAIAQAIGAEAGHMKWRLGHFDDGILRGVDIARQHAGRCCDLHNRNCEPPSELCCWRCTEANHPDHPPGEQCIAPDLSGSGQP